MDRGVAGPCLVQIYPALRQNAQDECRFCCPKFADTTKCKNHMRRCSSMPFDGWLWRLWATLLKVPNSTVPCVHCGTCFTVPKAAGRHSVECSKRRHQDGLLVPIYDKCTTCRRSRASHESCTWFSVLASSSSCCALFFCKDLVQVWDIHWSTPSPWVSTLQNPRFCIGL